MNEHLLKNYNLDATLLGGQAFNWDFFGDSYYGFTQDKLIVIKPAPLKKPSISEVNKSENPNDLNPESDIRILWQTYPVQNNFEYINRYFGLSENIDDTLLKIQKDEHLRHAIKTIPHIRILNQDFEQTLLSFILSSHKSIKGVRKLVRELSRLYGEKLEMNNKDFYLFPKTEVLANINEADLRKAGAGFRSRYLKAAAENLLELRSSNINLNNNEDLTRSELLKFIGIGDKIADCIMTFSLGFKSITPLDIWGKRVLIDLYKVNPKLSYEEMRAWYKDYFGENTSIAGQYLFEYYRRVYSKKLSS